MTPAKTIAVVVLIQAALFSAQSTRDLPMANQQFKAGQFKEADNTYSALAVVSPDLAEAHVGLVRTRLFVDNVPGAMDAIRDGLKALPNSAAITAAAGDVQFRLARFQDALALYQRALQLDPNLGRAWWGIGRIEMISSMKKSAREHFMKAYALAPQDADIVLDRAWAAESSEKIALGLEQYVELASFQPAPKLASLQEQIDIYKLLAQKEPCASVQPLVQTSVKLRSLSAPAAGFDRYSPSFLVNASINGAKAGNFRPATGRQIVLSPNYAKSVRVRKVSTSTNTSSSYLGIADRLKVGGVEFQNCIVSVSESMTNRGNADGMLGLGLFSDFLLTLDFGKGDFTLSPLPPLRQGETSRWADLDPALDRKDFTRILQIGQELAVPVRINSSQQLLFAMRIESNTSVVGAEIGERVLHIRSPFGTEVPYTGPCSINCVSVDVGGRQANAELLPVSLAASNYNSGTQFDGMLGTNVLNQFVVTIDSRNGFIKLDKFR